MGRKLFYFPSIIISTSALKWAILYWDKISSVMPNGFDPTRYENYTYSKNAYYIMKIVEDNGIYEPIIPDVNIDDIYEDLYHQTNLIQPKKHWEQLYYDNVHISKMNDNIISHLKASKLLINSDLGDYWYKVEKDASILYMSLLTKKLARIDPNDTITYTDSYHSSSLLSTSNESEFLGFNLDFFNMLPTLDDKISIFDVIRFKNKYYDDLLSFRTVMDEFESKFAQSQTIEEAKHINEQFSEIYKIERKNMDSIYKDIGFKLVTSSFRSLIETKIPLVLFSSYSAGWIAGQISPEYTIPSSVATFAFNYVLECTQTRNLMQKEINQNPFSYLYRAEQQGVIQH